MISPISAPAEIPVLEFSDDLVVVLLGQVPADRELLRDAMLGTEIPIVVRVRGGPGVYDSELLRFFRTDHFLAPEPF